MADEHLVPRKPYLLGLTAIVEGATLTLFIALSGWLLTLIAVN